MEIRRWDFLQHKKKNQTKQKQTPKTDNQKNPTKPTTTTKKTHKQIEHRHYGKYSDFSWETACVYSVALTITTIQSSDLVYGTQLFCSC